MTFNEYWKSQYGDVILKARLTTDELQDIREMIKSLSGKSSSVAITYLQKHFDKLSERWKAERVYWTESKRMDTKEVKADSQELGFDKFRIKPNINACEACKSFSDNGSKVFNKNENVYKGRVAPPIHPNCYCILLPTR